MSSGIAGTSALITDIDRRKALPIIRALGVEKVRVVGVSYRHVPLGGFSKYCSRVHICADYRSQPDRFLDDLQKIMRTERPDVFYALEDEALSLCSRNRVSWSPYTEALIPASDTLEKAYDKWQTIQIAEAAGIPVPHTFCPTSLEEVASLASRWEGPAVIKPRKSSGSRGLCYVNTPSQMLESYRKVSAHYSRPLIQEKIPAQGAGLGVFVLMDKRGDVKAIFGHKRLREYPVSGGPSTLCVSYRDDQLVEQSISLLRMIGMVGVAMVEYKVDTKTDKPILMEINPRFWGSLQLAVFAGVNFPVLYHRIALGLETEPVVQFPTGKYWRWLWPGDILHFLQNPERFRLKPSFFDFRTGNTSYDLSWDDPMPALGALIDAMRKIAVRGR